MSLWLLSRVEADYDTNLDNKRALAADQTFDLLIRLKFAWNLVTTATPLNLPLEFERKQEVKQPTRGIMRMRCPKFQNPQ